MRFTYHFIAYVCIFGFNFPAIAEDKLIEFRNGKTYIECSLANAAIKKGFFQKFDNPQVVGECPNLVSTTQIVPSTPPPMPPVWPPIGPWCDCTDEQLKKLETLFKENSFAVNPGFNAVDPVDAWAKSLGTTKKVVKTPEFWKNNTVPDLRKFKGNRYLQFKN